MIDKRAKRGTAGQIILVPEQLSHETERLLQTLGDGIGLYAEALTFQRLAHRVLTRYGGLAAPQLDAGGRLLLLSRAVSAVRPSLTEWGRVAGDAGFLRELMDTIDELKCYECKPEHLTGSAKLSDLRLIWESFDALTAQTALDPRDLLSRVGELLGGGDFADGVMLYIDGFISFTAQEYGIIKAFINRGDVTALLNAPRGGGDEYFLQHRITAARLKRLAGEAGFDETEIPDGERTRAVDGSLRGDPERVSVLKCGDMIEECRRAAALVRSWVDNEGVRYRDIAIASPAWDEYGGVLASVCARLDIPLFTDDVTPVSGKAAARFISASLEAVMRGFGPDEMTALLKTGLAPLSADDCYIMEDYIRVHNLRGLHWTQDKPWSMHPSGWGVRAFTELDTKRVDSLNAARVKLRGPLMKLRRAMPPAGKASGETLARALYDYCDGMGLAKALSARREYLAARGFARRADECRQLWEIITSAFDGFVDILGGEGLTADEFARLFSLCLSQYGVGVIPLSADSLRAGPLDRLYRRELKRLVVVGANERDMPGQTRAAGLLTDEERVILEGGGVFLAPKEDERASRVLYNIRAALTLPSDALALTYSAAAGEPSMFIDMLGIQPAEAGREPDGGGEAWHSDRSPLTGGLLTDGRPLSASRAETYNSCRWQYFARYTLKARARGGNAPSPMDAGSMIHRVLERMVKGAAARGGFRAVTRGEALELAENAAAEWIDALPDFERGGARVRVLTERLKKSAVQVAGNVYDELACSKFEPLAAEYEFTTRGGAPLTGIIDRVDGWLSEDRLYIRVVDYKSGRASFSLRDIWHGLGIQMLCYLFALDAWEGAEAVPAGVLYLPAHDRFARLSEAVSDEEITRKLYAAMRRDGLILDDPEVIEAMEAGPDKIFLPVRLNGDGSPDRRYSQIADAARLGLLRRHTERVMEELSGNMRRGLVNANPVSRNPVRSHCDWCEFADSCFFDDGDSPRLLASMDGGEFWERIGDA